MVQHSALSHASIAGAVVVANSGTALGTASVINFANGTATFSGGTATYNAPAASGGAGSVVFYDEGNLAGTAAIVNLVGSSGTVAVSGGTATITLSASGGGTPSHSYFNWKAAMLEPLAVSQTYYGSASAGSVAVGTATKLVLAAWQTKLNGVPRWDLREPREPMPISSGTIQGGSANSTFALIDPSLASYSNAWQTYYDRLYTLGTAAVKVAGTVGANGWTPFLPGPYGAIITSVSFHDTTWIGLTTPLGTAASLLPIHDEIGDVAGGASGAGDDMRMSHTMLLPVSKNVATGLSLGAGGNPDQPAGAVTYYMCPSSWGSVTDPNTYDFRDDFMGGSLDTATKWTRTQTSAGTVEIDSTWPWLRVRGNGTWGQNGAFSQTGVNRAAGKVFEADVFIDGSLSAAGTAPNFIFGWHDGAGQSFSDFSHGVYFSISGSPAHRIFVFENGNNRGTVGAWSAGAMYRVRITLAAGSATYQLQGGTEYAAFGGTAWTTVNSLLGTASSSITSPVYAGVSQEGTVASMVGDVRLY